MIETNPIRIPGSWRQGYALDYHTLRSTFVGHDEFGHPLFETERSAVGEALYRLKYKSDYGPMDELVETTANFIEQWEITFDWLLPVPPSRKRRYQPVLELARRVAVRLSLPLCEDCALKGKATAELKNVYSYEERMQLLENAYHIDKQRLQGKNVLLLDDLYRSGATLNALTSAVYHQGTAASVYVLALTRTRSAT
jgi:competence protein ComFC